MEASPDPWISALRHSHDRLRASVEPLGPDQLAQRSYPSEWTIAQVLSHLGSQAEIFGLMLEAGLAGQEPPGPRGVPADLGQVERQGPAGPGDGRAARRPGHAGATGVHGRR